MLSKLRRRKLKVSLCANGLIEVEDHEFRERCAVYTDGRYFLVKGYNGKDVQDVLKALRSQGHLPPADQCHKKIVTIDDIRRHYDEGHEVQSTVRHTGEDNIPAQKKFEQLLERAADLRASDVEMIQNQHKTLLRMRIAGKDTPIDEEWTAADGRAAMAAVFSNRDSGAGHSGMSEITYQSFAVSRDGGRDDREDRLKLPSSVVKLRGQKGFHEIGNGMGSHMVLRLFFDDENDQTGSLEDLGLDEDVMEELATERRIKDGTVIIGGTTGNGKSTTLINLTNQIFRDHEGHISIATFEDPVEIRACSEAVKQSPVLSTGSEEDVAKAWGEAFKHLVRINPDVGVIGEMRDGVSAASVLRFVISGHKALTTVHVGSANAIPFRLINWNVSPAEVASEGALSLLLRQVLVPKLCEHCKVPASQAELEDLQQALDRALRQARQPVDRFIPNAGQIFSRNPEGCPHCVAGGSEKERKTAWAGIERMIAVAEYIRPDATYRSYISKRDSQGAYDYWLKPREEGGLGGLTVGARLARRVLAGEVDFLSAQNRARDLADYILRFGPDLTERDAA
jgi:type II secretory ATPase GspE/PulE/Tfp pilus assembly ATPase PilB-like protein